MFNRRKYQIFVLIKHFDKKVCFYKEKKPNNQKKSRFKSFELFTKKNTTCALGQSSLKSIAL